MWVQMCVRISVGAGAVLGAAIVAVLVLHGDVIIAVDVNQVR